MRAGFRAARLCEEIRTAKLARPGQTAPTKSGWILQKINLNADAPQCIETHLDKSSTDWELLWSVVPTHIFHKRALQKVPALVVACPQAACPQASRAFARAGRKN
jgi:hypothetical protein